MEISEFLKNISVILGAISLILGIRAWKREYIGKRKIELAEETLMLFYQARDAIREIRNPFGREGEGGTRKKGAHESEGEAKILDQAYVVIERFEKREDIFNKLQATRYRFMARFGSDTEKPFLELNQVIKDIFLAAHMLGTYYWQKQGRVKMEGEEFKKHLDEMHKYEAIFWYQGDALDEIGPRIDNIIKRIEDITKEVMSEREVWFKKIF
jgi:hypothetical protein